MTEPTTRTLEAPGAVLAYDVRRADSPGAPVLLLIGCPMGAGGFSGPRPPMGGGPRPPMGGGPPSADGGPYRQPRGGDANRNFGPNKPPKGRGGSNFAKNRNQEGKARGPLKERLSGRMFSVDEDARFRDEDDTGVDETDLNKVDETDLTVKEEEVKEEEVKEDDE